LAEENGKSQIANVKLQIEEQVAGDGYRWRYRRFVPIDSPRAEVVCIHGIQSHGGWYEYSCGKLAEAGFAVSFLDRRGSGMNERDRGDAPGFRRLLDDLAEYLQPLRSQAPSLPVFLVGISWGGKLAVALERRHPGLVDGLALLCPGFFSLVRPTWKQRLGIAWSRLVAPRRLFPIPLNDPALFTATPRWQEFVRNDPLALRQATARLLVESVRLDGYLRWASKYVTQPILLLLAQCDRIIDNARTRAFVDKLPSRDKQVIEYAGAHHTLEFEPNPDRFIADLQGWLERQTTKS
jgi:alpha-beta hydrolase superfamily lysophospholipase